MTRWQSAAIRLVYQALNEMPSGQGGSASTSVRRLSVACAAVAEVKRPAKLVLEALAAGDDRETVGERVEELRSAMVRAEAIGD